MYTPQTLVTYCDLTSDFPDYTIHCTVSDFAHQYGDCDNLEQAIEFMLKNVDAIPSVFIARTTKPKPSLLAGVSRTGVLEIYSAIQKGE